MPKKYSYTNKVIIISVYKQDEKKTRSSLFVHPFVDGVGV